MKFLIPSVLSVAMLSLISANPASASTVTYTVTPSVATDASTYASTSAATSNWTDMFTLSSGTTYVGSGYKQGYYKEPTGVDENTTYLSVYTGGTATLSLASGTTSLSFEWGSVDSSNTLTIKYNDETPDTIISGSDLINGKSIQGSTTSVLFTLTNLENVASIVLTSKTNSFEIANLKINSVPLPAGLPLFGMALAGLGIARRKKN